jgi:hypothetical protein
MPLADPIDVAVGYLIAKHGLDLDEAEALVKADSPMGAANTSLDRGREWLQRNKTIESARAAYRTAASRELAEELADKRWRFPAGVNDDGRRFPRTAKYERTHARVQASITHRQVARRGR